MTSICEQKISAEVRLINGEQFVIFKLLSYCFEETIGFDVKSSFTSRLVSRLVRWSNKPADLTK